MFLLDSFRETVAMMKDWKAAIMLSSTVNTAFMTELWSIDSDWPTMVCDIYIFKYFTI